MQVGFCLDAMNPPAAPQTYPFARARLVAFDDPLFFRYHDHLRSLGVSVTVLLARESFGQEPDYKARSVYYAERIRPDAWILGNQPDVEAADSWTMSAAHYAKFFSECHEGIRTLRAEPIYMAGLASGTGTFAKYLNALRRNHVKPDGATVHLYGIPVPESERILRSFLMSGFPVQIGEWSLEDSQVADFAQMADDLGVPWFYFCYSDAQLDTYGAFDAGGNPKPVAHIFTALQSGLTASDIHAWDHEVPPGNIPEGDDMPPIEPEAAAEKQPVGPGILARMDVFSDHPLGQEEYLRHEASDGYTMSRCLGTQGWYYASNYSGQWETAGPFADGE